MGSDCFSSDLCILITFKLASGNNRSIRWYKSMSESGRSIDLQLCSKVVIFQRIKRL